MDVWRSRERREKAKKKEKMIYINTANAFHTRGDPFFETNDGTNISCSKKTLRNTETDFVLLPKTLPYS